MRHHRMAAWPRSEHGRRGEQRGRGARGGFGHDRRLDSITLSRSSSAARIPSLAATHPFLPISAVASSISSHTHATPSSSSFGVSDMGESFVKVAGRKTKRKEGKSGGGGDGRGGGLEYTLGTW